MKLNPQDRQQAIAREGERFLRETGYAKGELKIKREHYLSVRTDDNHGAPHFGFELVVLNAPIAELPHSCEEWVIGGPDHIRALITDLEAALREMKEETPGAAGTTPGKREGVTR